MMRDGDIDGSWEALKKGFEYVLQLVRRSLSLNAFQHDDDLRPLAVVIVYRQAVPDGEDYQESACSRHGSD